MALAAGTRLGPYEILAPHRGRGEGRGLPITQLNVILDWFEELEAKMREAER